MSSTRAAKSGYARDTQEKQDAKYDSDLACEMLKWIQIYVKDPPFSTDGSMDNLFTTLMDGHILRTLVCELNSRLNVGDVSKRKVQKMAFMKMEDINVFLDAISKTPYCVPTSELFQTVDLYERMNLTSVVICLASLSRKVKMIGLQGVGPKEAAQNKRDFSEEQLKAGSGIIGLQMGTNKGASQAGQSFGKTRGINDIELSK